MAYLSDSNIWKGHHHSSLGSHCVPWLGEGLSMPFEAVDMPCPGPFHFSHSVHYIYDFCPLPDPNVGPSIFVCDVEHTSCHFGLCGRKFVLCLFGQLVSRARIHESVITYDGHISSPGSTELELGPSENSYSLARKRSVIAVLEVVGFHTGCLVTKRCTAHGRQVICPARQSSGE